MRIMGWRNVPLIVETMWIQEDCAVRCRIWCISVDWSGRGKKSDRYDEVGEREKPVGRVKGGRYKL